MSIALVQTVKNNYTATPHTISITSSGSGNLIVVLFAHEPSTNLVLGITDNVGNVYTQVPGALAVQTSGFSGTTDIWYTLNSLPGATAIIVTLTSSSGNKTVLVQEYSGVATSSAIDVSGHLSNQTGTSPVGPSLVTSQNNEVLVTAIAEQNTDSLTNVSSPWIPVGDLPAANADRGQAYLITSSSGTYQANFVPTGSAIFCSSAVAFLSSPPALTLNLFDSLSTGDSMTDSFSLPFSENMSSSDTAPESFSVVSDFVAVVNTPTVETLVNQLVPASVKTYFKIQE